MLLSTLTAPGYCQDADLVDRESSNPSKMSVEDSASVSELNTHTLNSAEDPSAAIKAAGLAPGKGPSETDFSHVVRVTCALSLDGVVLHTNSMAGVVLSTKPLTIATCQSITRPSGQPAILEMSSNIDISFSIQTLTAPSEASGNSIPPQRDSSSDRSEIESGSVPNDNRELNQTDERDRNRIEEHNSNTADADNGQPDKNRQDSEAQINLDFRDSSRQDARQKLLTSVDAIAVDGLLFLIDKSTASGLASSLSPINLNANDTESKHLFTIEYSYSVEHGVTPKRSDPSQANRPLADGVFMMSDNGFVSLIRDGRALTAAEIWNAFMNANEMAKSRQNLASLNADNVALLRGDSFQRDGQSTHRLDSLQGQINHKAQKAAISETLVPIILRVKLATNEAERLAARRELIAMLSLEFDAQRSLRNVELNLLKQRISQLEREEDAKAKMKQAIIHEKMKLLLEE